MKILGIDEAGRGPVIGPLVVAGAMLEESDEPRLKKLGVKDSKLVTPKKRAQLYKEIKKLTKHKIIIVSPQEIDAALESEELNLNLLEAEKAIKIINALNPDRAIVDCPSPNLKAFKDYLYQRIKNKTIELVVEHKADVKYISCSAASILAKEIREQEMEKIKKKYGDCGPGYPANPITQKFLQENWEKYPEIFRHSWSSYKNHKNKKKQQTLKDF